MVDEPDGGKKKNNSDEGLEITRKKQSGAYDATKGGNQPQDNPPQIPWYQRFFLYRWFFGVVHICESYSGSITAIATIWIAAFTIVLACVSIYQGRTLEGQLKESRREFASTQRARMVLGNDKGEIMNIVDSGDKASILIYLRNGGHSAAHEMVANFHILIAPPTTIFAYKSLYPPPVTGGFVTGPTVGEGQPLPLYIDLGKQKEGLIKAGKMFLRVVGAVSYWDDFGRYCDRFGVNYYIDPVRFVQTMTPPQGICRPSTEDTETLQVLSNGKPFSSFQMGAGETFSYNQPGATQDQDQN